MITQIIGTLTKTESMDEVYFVGTGGAHVYYFSFGNGKTKYGSLSN